MDAPTRSTDNDIVEFVNAGYNREVPYSIVKLSKLVCDAVEGNDDDDDDGNDDSGVKRHTITVSDDNVTIEVLEKVIEFCTHYHEEKMNEIGKFPEKDDILLTDLVQEWYANFAKGMERKVLFQLLISANYLHIQPLLDLSCLAVAKHIHKKSEDEMRAIFNIKKPVRAEKKEQKEGE